MIHGWGYTCPSCGHWIPPNLPHYCFQMQVDPASTTWPAPSVSPCPYARIARARLGPDHDWQLAERYWQGDPVSGDGNSKPRLFWGCPCGAHKVTEG